MGERENSLIFFSQPPILLTSKNAQRTKAGEGMTVLRFQGRAKTAVVHASIFARWASAGGESSTAKS